MDIIKFNLKGGTAFFKKPDVNAYFYFTYGCIYKIALLGIFGAICGYGGYNQQQSEDTVYPEFYEKLKGIKIGIKPNNNKGYITKKIQIFNNSVGYASKEEGGNLIIKEQWLENPEWDIYVQLQDTTNELGTRLIDGKFEYIPYLGKNDHVADIGSIQLLRGIKLEDTDIIDSIFSSDVAEIVKDNGPFNFDSNTELFKYEEMLPITLEKTTNNYELDTFIFTNNKIKLIENDNIYDCNGKIIYFF